MKGIIIIPGFDFSYPVIDKALQWAQDNKAELKAVWITSGRSSSEDYPFPNDMRQAEAEQSAIAPDNTEQQLSRDQFRLLQSRANAVAVAFSGLRLNRPSLHTVLEHCKDADRVFVETTPEDQEFLLEGIRFNQADLLAGIAGL